MFEKEAEIYALSNFGFRGKNSQRVLTAKIDYQYGAEFGYNKAKEELERDNNRLFLEGAKRVEELEAQIEKLIDFVLSKIECCDVCPLTDTCINSEGTCPYAGILVKDEKEVTRKWLIRFISRR